MKKLLLLNPTCFLEKVQFGCNVKEVNSKEIFSKKKGFGIKKLRRNFAKNGKVIPKALKESLFFV